MEDFQQTVPFEQEQAGQYLTFKLHTEFYGIQILKVREIIGLIQVTRVPRVPEHVKGVINLRGKLIPIIDLRLKFGLPAEDYTKRTCIIVVEVQGVDDFFPIGVVVDEVDEVVDLRPEQIEAAPNYHRAWHTEFIRAMGKIGGQVKILLDIDRVITHEEAVLLQELKA